MKKKSLYVVLPALALLALGASSVSAQGWMGFGHSATPAEVAERQTSMFQEQADLLGLSVDAVKTSWAEGKTLEELATANGVSEADLKIKIQAAAKTRMTEHLKALVDQGVITQAQADQRLIVIEERQANGYGKGFGMGGGKHMRGGMGMGLGF